MKRVIIFVAFMTILVTNAMAQRDETGSTISFINEIGYETTISVPVLAEIIAYSDTISEEKFCVVTSIYEEMFACEGRLVILIPDDDYFNVIFIQEDEDGEILELQALTKEGWIEAESEPYSREFIDLASIICMIQHILEVSGP